MFSILYLVSSLTDGKKHHRRDLICVWGIIQEGQHGGHAENYCNLIYPLAAHKYK